MNGMLLSFGNSVEDTSDYLSGRNDSMMWLTKLDRVVFFLFGRYEYLSSLFCASTPLFVSTAQWYSLSRNA